MVTTAFHQPLLETSRYRSTSRCSSQWHPVFRKLFSTKADPVGSRRIFSAKLPMTISLNRSALPGLGSLTTQIQKPYFCSLLLRDKPVSTRPVTTMHSSDQSLKCRRITHILLKSVEQV